MAEADGIWRAVFERNRDYEARLRLLSPIEFRLLAEATELAERIEADGGDMVKVALTVQKKANSCDVFCAVFDDASEPSGFGFAPLKGIDDYERLCAGEELEATVGACLFQYENLELLDDLINSREYNHHPFH